MNHETVTCELDAELTTEFLPTLKIDEKHSLFKWKLD